ncbi:unnamed protein product [Cladocopium goreaui]|uniref:Pentatricopeptide repeat-containing protein, chloroplastic n=1 Tax=Cladocopium goreaui TaxID=2562237 RepID=A0A9P1GD76_9DINO|nr:unnamed protein product [Cladocopium goreaui]
MKQGLPYFTSKTKHVLDWQQLLDLAAEIKAARLQPGTVSFNAIAAGYGRFSQWHRSLEVLTFLKVEGLEVDGASFGAVIGASQKGQMPGAHWPLASLLLCSGRKHAASSLAALSSTLAAIARASRWAKAQMAFQSAVEKGCIVNIVNSNCLLSSFSQGLQWELALNNLWSLRSLRSIGPTGADVVSFNTAMDACTSNPKIPDSGHRWQLICALFAGLATQRLVSNIMSFGTLIAGFAGQHTKRAPEWMYALRAYRMVKQLTVEPNSIMAGALAGACSAKHAWERSLATANGHERKVMLLLPAMNWEGAHRLCCLQASRTWTLSLSKMTTCRSSTVRGDMVTLCALAKPLQEVQRWREITDLLHRFWSLEVSVIAFGLLASSCSRSHCWTQAVQAMETGSWAAAPPDLELHHMAANGCAKSSHWAFSLDLLRALNIAQLRLDISSAQSILPGMATQHFWQRALQIRSRPIGSAQERHFELAIWSSIGKWEHAQRLIRLQGPQATTNAYSMGLASLASAQKVKESLELLNAMKLQSLRPDVPHLLGILATGCSWDLGVLKSVYRRLAVKMD